VGDFEGWIIEKSGREVRSGKMVDMGFGETNLQLK
jgi:hypothetical protein